MTSDDAAQLEYAYSYLRRQYLGPRLTSGVLAVDGVYLLQSFKSGDDFANVGAEENASGILFSATGTTPAGWTKNSRLRLINLAGLKTLSTAVFEEATDTVTLTSSSFEGGQGSGVVNFRKFILGKAIEKLLNELDPDYDAPPVQGSGFVMQFAP